MKIRYGTVNPKHIDCLYDYGDMSTKSRIWTPLMKSVKEKGFVNPVIVWANNKGILSPIYGISRLQVGDKLNRSVPAIICDYIEAYPHYPEIEKTAEAIAAYWAVPEQIAPHLRVSDSKVWMCYHPRVDINDEGETF